jgi:hypothetical protein
MFKNGGKINARAIDVSKHRNWKFFADS